MTIARILAIVSGVLIVAIPVNFYTLTDVGRWLSFFGLIGGAGAVALIVCPGGRPDFRVAALSVATVWLLLGLASGEYRVPAEVLLTLGAGAALGVFTRTAAWQLRLVMIAAVVTVLIDSAFRAPVVAEFWGQSKLDSFATVAQFRARGFIGQPVPMGVIGVTVAMMLAIRAHSVSGKWVWVVSGGLVLVLTGTRTGLLALAAAALILVFARLRRTTRIPSQLVIVSPFVLTGAILLSSRLQAAGQLRALDFNALRGTDSLTNRQRALDVAEAFRASCHGTCWAFGQGGRSLQDYLTASAGYRYSTVDNFYVTALWDYGLVGLLGLLATCAWFIRAAYQAQSSIRLAGAVGGVMAMTSGVFFDILYVRPTCFLVGVCLALAAGASDATDGARAEENCNVR